MIRQSETARQFQSRYLVDRGGLLRPGGRRELLREMARLRDGGAVARVLLVPRGEDLAPWRGVWDELRLEERTDLLLLFNGDRWEARGWALTPEAIGRALEAAEADLRVYYARGLSGALRNLAEASPTGPAPGDATGWLPIWVGGLLMLVIAMLSAFVIRRRMRVARESLAAFHGLLDTARSAFAQVVLEGEEMALLDPEGAQQLQLRAAEIEKELEGLERDVEAHPQKAAQAVTRGRVQHLHNELRVLTSTILQERT